jgi:2-iminobutanoate/2-iminopropanoate deaminase
LREETVEKQIVNLNTGPAGNLPLSPAVAAGPMLYVSGQVAVDRATGRFTGGDTVAQTHQVIKNVEQVLAAGGSSLAKVIKVTAYLADIEEFAAFNDVYRTYFSSEPPARTTIQARLIPPYTVEIDAIAIRSDT